jgi:predicted dehydrogenase
MDKVNVGVIGCGNICGIYFKNLKRFPFLDVTACADIDVERAKAKATEFGIKKACTAEELLKDRKVHVVVNLTVPLVHGEIALAAVKKGKSVYNEKPLCVHRADAKKLVAKAAKKGVRVGCAPDTFMGAGLQTCRKLIDDGVIGQPVAATAFMLGGGPEGWHPNPAFFYQVGGGPMFDMGPYYVTALVSLLGPVETVAGMARISFPERTIGSGEFKGQKVKVEIPTHIVGVLKFTSGPIGNLITSFDVKGGANLPRIEIYGSEGTLCVPDPNSFGGPVKVKRLDEKEYREVPLTHGYEENSRGIGVADMVLGKQNNRTHRASGDLAFHVLDVMHAIHEAAAAGKHAALKSTCERPKALPTGLQFGQLD